MPAPKKPNYKKLRNRRTVGFTDREDTAIRKAAKADGWNRWARRVLLMAAGHEA